MIKEKRTKRTKRGSVKAPSKQRLLEQTQASSGFAKSIKKPLQDEDVSSSSETSTFDVATAMMGDGSSSHLAPEQYHDDILSLMSRTSEPAPASSPRKASKPKAKKSKAIKLPHLEDDSIVSSKSAASKSTKKSKSKSSSTSKKSSSSTTDKKKKTTKTKVKKHVSFAVATSSTDTTSSSSSSTAAGSRRRNRPRSDTSVTSTSSNNTLGTAAAAAAPVKATFMQIERVENPTEIWWQESDMRFFRQRNGKLVDRLQENDDFIWAVETIHRSHDETKITEAAFNEAFYILTKIANDKKHPRGLELHVACDTARRQIEKHRDAVFQAFYQDDEHGKPRDAAWLRKESRVWSKPSRVFAAAMADYDAQEAAVVYTSPASNV